MESGGDDQARTHRIATLCVVGAAVLFGTTGTAQHLGPHTSSPLTVGSLRLVAGGVLLVLYVTARPEGLAGLRIVMADPLGIICGAAMAVYNAFFFFGTARAGVAIGTLVALGSAPFLTGLLGWFLDRRPPGPRWTLATVVSVGGLGLLVSSGHSNRGSSVLEGAGYAFLAAFGYAVYTAMGKRLVVRVDPDIFIGGVFAWGGLLLSPVLLVGLPAGRLRWVASLRGVGLVVWLAVIHTVVAYILFSRGLRRLPAATVATLTLAEPLIATGLGVVVVHEHLGAGALLGALLVLTGLLVLATGASRR
jgi:DME family drug/metabolite transporter